MLLHHIYWITTYTVIADLDLFCLPNVPIEPTNVVKIEDPPVAIFSTNTPQCQDNNIVFTNETEVGCDGNTLNTQLDSVLYFQWDFGDCSTLLLRVISLSGVEHKYAQPGEYLATLTVNAACGLLVIQH